MDVLGVDVVLWARRVGRACLLLPVPDLYRQCIQLKGSPSLETTAVGRRVGAVFAPAFSADTQAMKILTLDVLCDFGNRL